MMKKKFFACVMLLTSLFLLVNCQSQPAEVAPTAAVAQNTAAPTKTATTSPTATATFTAVPSATATSTPTATITPTNTATRKPTNTPRPTNTPKPTNTPLPPTVLDEYQLVLTFPAGLPLTVKKQRQAADPFSSDEITQSRNLPRLDRYTLVDGSGQTIGDISIFPVEEYKAVHDGVSNTISNWQTTINQQGAVDGLSILPLPYTARSEMALRQTYHTFAQGTGVRFLTAMTDGQVATMFGPEAVFYYWLGFSADGKYLVVGHVNISFTLPTDENSIALADVEKAYSDWGGGEGSGSFETFNALWEPYRNQLFTGITNLPAEQFSPSLNDIDAIFQNMQLLPYDPNAPTPTPAPTATPLPEFKAVVGSSYNANASFYSCPKSDGPQLGGYIRIGEEIQVVLGRSTTGNWLYVQHDGQTGWISVPLLTITGDVLLLPDVEATNGQCP